MADRSFLDWPFFEQSHRELAVALDDWATSVLGAVDHSNIDAACRQLVSMLGEAGFAAHSAAMDGRLDVRSLCLIRETLARHDGLADFAFAMQGLGSGAISLFGSAAQQAACALLASGMDGSIACQNTVPTNVRCPAPQQ